MSRYGFRVGPGSVPRGAAPQVRPDPTRTYGSRRIGATQKPFSICGWLSMGRSAYFQAGE